MIFRGEGEREGKFVGNSGRARRAGPTPSSAGFDSFGKAIKKAAAYAPAKSIRERRRGA